MMKRSVQAASIWMFLLLGACTKEPGYHVSEYQEIKFEDVPEEVKIPTKAWDLLEFKPAVEGATSLGKNLIFSELTVYLVEKNPGVVEGEAIKIQLPRGGGTIDLSRFITDRRGTFYVGFEFPEFTDATGKKVLFLSKARKRRLGSEIFGAGCNQYFDITDEFFKKMKAEGLKVNSTQDRYLSVLGGSFLFAAEKGADVHLAQVRFTNSQQPQFFCEER
ncbi:hypothetical protein predicted by Glimmer/Critica [Bdellovibrio bacteriovorus HD100]|uniref:Lipoprotein n=2 Tax=Bdellovibrio bacteriovorus TaxID=959 RepID=Q6MIN5_BDEBA|nr:hypothetical protein predicted by Glimmer/Critica [Bdellovibrio bacteriovorus HD100]